MSHQNRQLKKTKFDLLLLLEFSDLVLTVIENPICIEYLNRSGCQAYYTPPFLVHYKTNSRDYRDQEQSSCLLDVSNSNIDSEPKYIAAQVWAQEEGYVFRVFGPKELNSVLATNVSFLNSNKSRILKKEIINKISNHLSCIGHSPIDHVVLSLSVTNSHKNEVFSHICALLSTRTIGCNMQSTITNKTIIWLNNERATRGAYEKEGD